MWPRVHMDTLIENFGTGKLSSIVPGRQVPIFSYFSQHTPIFPIFFFSNFLLFFLFFFSNFTFSDCQLKTFYFRISVEMYLLYIDFSLLQGRFVSAYHVLNWAGLCLTVCLLSGGWNNAPSCACREMGQRLTRAPSNCGKS